MSSEREYRERLDQLEEQLTVIYRERRRLMAEYADTHPAPPMPSPRGRSEHQQRIARCPRCGDLLSERDGAKK